MRSTRPVLLLTPFLLLPLSLHAQQHRASDPKPEAPATSLPVTHVSLYKNGVGFFEHTGHVTGNASVTIDFTSGQLNDVLQSLTAIDLNGGRISGAAYNSTTPLDQQLKTLPLSLDDNPTSGDFYSAIRGARIEVHSGAVSITGRLLSVEVRKTPLKSSDSTETMDRFFLTVVADSGETRTLELTPATSVKLLDTALHNDVTRYLQLLDANRSQDLRHLTLDDRGTGSRELRVSYISEVPIWKSTYRILFTDGSPTATIQGWSVVDNTTGTDWINVQLSLIAGAPQSFIQPLSQPIYSRRPEVPIAQEAQLNPQTFDSGIDANDNKQFDRLETVSKLMSPAVSPSARVRTSGSVAGMSGMAGGVPGGIINGMPGGTTSGPAINVAAPSYEQFAETSITPTAKAAGFDDFFAYNLTEPITIRKNESALVPILQTKLPADRVTLVNFNGSSTSQPLRALWVTNTSNLTLDRGSFTVVESGAFGGEGLLDPVHPGEKRLLSYAADQAIHVAVDSDKTTNHINLIHGSKGVVNIHRADTHNLDFAIHNAASDKRSVVLEMPVAGGYKIVSDPKPTETTPTVYRFRVEVAAGDTAKLHIAGEREGYTTYYLTRSDDNQLSFLLSETDHNPAFEAALQPVLQARMRVAEAQIAVDQTKSRLDGLHADEERQRTNITALANADKASRDRFVRDLNTTEDKITAAQAELANRTASLDAAKSDLANKIDAFTINEKP